MKVLIVLVLLLILFCKPIFVLYIRAFGVKTNASLRFVNRNYNVTSCNKSTGRSWVVEEKTTTDVHAKYKANKRWYNEKPLNSTFVLRYQSRQSVPIKYLKQNPKYFLVLNAIQSDHLYS